MADRASLPGRFRHLCPAVSGTSPGVLALCSPFGHLRLVVRARCGQGGANQAAGWLKIINLPPR